HRGDQRARVVEGRHRAGETPLDVDVGTAQQVVGRDPAVGEGDDRGVGGTAAELVLEALDLHARCVLGDHERLDGSAAQRLVQRGPHDDTVGTVTGGDEDLLSVEDVFVAVLDGGRSECGRV